jgi:hypothetical protein
MLVLSGVITFLDGILLTHVLAVFCFSVKAGAFLVIDVGRRIYPDLTVASAGCWSHCRHWTLGAIHARSNRSRSRRHLSGGAMPVRLFRRGRRTGLGLGVTS